MGLTPLKSRPPIHLWLVCLLLSVSACLNWLTTPLQGGIKGYAFSLWNRPDLSIALQNPLQMASFGAVVGGLGLLGIALLCRRVYARSIVYLGGVAGAICLLFLGAVMCSHPQLLDTLVDQHQQAKNIRLFATAYLGVEGNAQYVTHNTTLNTDHLVQRLWLGLHAMGFGWYVAVGCTGWLILAVQKISSQAVSRWDLRIVLGVWLAVGAVLAGKPLMGEWHRLKGDRLQAQGDLGRALDHYATALTWEPYLASNPKYVVNLGAIGHRLGWEQHPATHLYLGDHAISANLDTEAIHHYASASRWNAHRELASRKQVNALMHRGLTHYKQDHIQAALNDWRQALRLDPQQLQAHFYFAKVFLDMDMRDQSQGIAAARSVLRTTRDQLIKADAYNLLGQMYYKQHDFVTAREMYRTSRSQYQLVKKIINFGAMRGLQGL